MTMLAVVNGIRRGVELHILLLTSTNAAPCQRARRTVIIVGQRAVDRDVAAGAPTAGIVTLWPVRDRVARISWEGYGLRGIRKVSE